METYKIYDDVKIARKKSIYFGKRDDIWTSCFFVIKNANIY